MTLIVLYERSLVNWNEKVNRNLRLLIEGQSWYHSDLFVKTKIWVPGHCQGRFRRLPGGLVRLISVNNAFWDQQSTDTGYRREAMARKRTIHRSRSGKKLCAIRDSKGHFVDIQIYERPRAHYMRKPKRMERPLDAEKGLVKTVIEYWLSANFQNPLKCFLLQKALRLWIEGVVCMDIFLWKWISLPGASRSSKHFLGGKFLKEHRGLRREAQDSRMLAYGLLWIRVCCSSITDRDWRLPNRWRVESRK